MHARSLDRLTLQADGSDPQWFASEGGARIELAVPTTRRGLRPLGRVTIATRYPLGLFRAFAYANFDQACLVYPRPSSETALPSPRAAGDPGRSGLAPGRDDFLGHRDFVHGDPPRHVDWKAAARTDRLLSKTFGEANQAEWWLDWDDHAGLDAETRLSHLCRGVLLAEASGRPYGLRLPGERFGPDTGSAHRHRCLRALALFADWP